MKRPATFILPIALIVGACATSFNPRAFAQVPNDLIPPDVTLGSGGGTGASAAASAAAPGMAGAATSTAAAPGLSGAAASLTTPGLPGAAARPANSGAPQPPPTGSGANPPSTPRGMGTPGAAMFHPEKMPDPNKPDPIAVIETDKGTITIRLFRKLAPITCENFIDLTTKGFYNGLTFHRVEPGFCIQGGCPNGTGTGLYIPPGTGQPRFVPLEINPQLKHNAAGVVAMARFGQSPNTASCQFYITLAPKPNLDNQYAVFGGVISGMDVVNSIAKGDHIKSISVQETQTQ
ncbi:MAG TPA: peptidylprolyl isomerase [Drouetiella sp.]